MGVGCFSREVQSLIILDSRPQREGGGERVAGTSSSLHCYDRVYSAGTVKLTVKMKHLRALMRAVTVVTAVQCCKKLTQNRETKIGSAIVRVDNTAAPAEQGCCIAAGDDFAHDFAQHAAAKARAH